jgi:hypothetical protein
MFWAIVIIVLGFAVFYAARYSKKKKAWGKKADELTRFLKEETGEKTEYSILTLTDSAFHLVITIPPSSDKTAILAAGKVAEKCVKWLMDNGFKKIFESAALNTGAFHVTIASDATGVTGKAVVHFYGEMTYDPDNDRVKWTKEGQPPPKLDDETETMTPADENKKTGCLGQIANAFFFVVGLLLFIAFFRHC